MTSCTRPAFLAPLLLLAGCATTTTYSRSYEASPPPAPLEGRVDSVREVVRRTQGDPAGGAVGGALIGGLLGGAISGRAGGAFVGAIGGAATGAAVSQGSSEERWYEVYVRFDDGSSGRIDYASPPPWRPGDRVRQSPHGLVRATPRTSGGSLSGSLSGLANEPTRNEPPPDLTPPPPPRELPPPPR